MFFRVAIDKYPIMMYIECVIYVILFYNCAVWTDWFFRLAIHYSATLWLALCALPFFPNHLPGM